MKLPADLGMGDVKAEIKIGWRNDAKIQNEFWGKLKLSGGPIKMAQEVQMRVGASAGRPYWIAGTNLPDVSLGVVRRSCRSRAVDRTGGRVTGPQPRRSWIHRKT